MILMSTLLVCSLESFAQSDAEVTDSLWKDVDLNAVTVVASKPLVKMETDKMTYNVQQDADAKASTVLDMLRKVPMVTVDGQDNITVNGSSSFKVYVDGKPNPMFSANPSQIFKAMPATMVKNIEVITNPGAKYDAEGTGGVLNIVLNKQAVNGGGGSDLSNGYNGTSVLLPVTRRSASPPSSADSRASLPTVPTECTIMSEWMEPSSPSTESRRMEAR